MLLKEVEAAKNLSKEEECVTEEGPTVVQHAVGFRRKQKMMFRQLKTCALLLDLVKRSDANGIKEIDQQQDIQLKVNEMRQKWKSLKSECRVQEEELQNMSTILEKFQALEAKEQALKDAIQLYEAKALCRISALVMYRKNLIIIERGFLSWKKQLEEVAHQKRLQLQKEQKLGLTEEKSLIEKGIEECSLSISKCHALIQQAQQAIQLMARKCGFIDSIHPCDFHTLSHLHQILETQSGVKVLAISEDQVTLRFDPRLLIPLTKLTPLVLTITWTSSETARLETDCAFLGLSDIKSLDLPSITAEIWKRYMSQAELWGEIQDLQNKYAIDWLESERKLRLLRLIASSSSNIIYTLYVEPGYPVDGEVKLYSIQENNRLIDMVIKPPQAKPLLTDWLEYLNNLDYREG
ncbi:uncharacterized protein si:dkey-225f5.4 isoform X2 [Hypanus sabinus]|uniref:uncharacterized protein si:dkey-225f5.4 isoform X2 n=1 Tax=Hypanus sabinus TaxID=79690 RepID=UPI0028C3C1FB|nr:uncharacterized protein si:dkey-225f5.4 isoform X2 [Hypanus sabinus]